jgi:hypothetical protein
MKVLDPLDRGPLGIYPSTEFQKTILTYNFHESRNHQSSFHPPTSGSRLRP